MREFIEELQDHLDLIPKPGETEFVYPDDHAVDAAVEQMETFEEIDWTEADILNIFNILYVIDVLNEKYLTEFDFTDVVLDDVNGLLTSFERAVGAVAYGVIDELHQHYGMQPNIYMALFGRRLGRFLFSYSGKYHSAREVLRALHAEGADDSAQLDLIWPMQYQMVRKLGMASTAFQAAADDIWNDVHDDKPLPIDLLAEEMDRQAALEHEVIDSPSPNQRNARRSNSLREAIKTVGDNSPLP